MESDQPPRHRRNLTFSGTIERSMKMKGLFKSKPRTPVDVVRQTRNLLIYAESIGSADHRDSKRDEKMAELCRNITEMKTILYGTCDTDPVAKDCQQLTAEFFKEDTLRLLINCLPLLNLEVRTHASQVVANLQRQQVQSKLIAADYLEANMDLIDRLIEGIENTDLALHYGDMLKECIRHQAITKYILESQHLRKFFSYLHIPGFVIAARAAEIFEGLLTRHKSTVAEFLAKNYDWFFPEYNSKLLESSDYFVRRYGTKVLGIMLLDRSNAVVMTKYVSSEDNLKILMNLLLEDSKLVPIEAFHVFKLFAANQKKPQIIAKILARNRSKLLRLLSELKPQKGYAIDLDQFEEDKAVVVREISALDPDNLVGTPKSS